MEGDRKRKIDDIHNDLKYDLAFEYLDSQSAKKFRGAASKHLSLADRSNFTEPFDIMDRLEATGNFAPGQYGIIRQIGEKIKEKNFVEAIEEAEKKIAKIEDDKQPKNSNDRITNIIDQTKKELDDHIADPSYVPLPVVDQIKKVLHRRGLVVLVGPSGCGKSKSVLQVLSKVKEGRVMKLPRLNDWSDLVQVAFENWVWFDDVFQKDPIDRHRPVMDTISACVRDKRTKVLFTVTSCLFEQYRSFFDILLSTDNIINFGDSQYEPNLEIRSKILHAHLHANGITIRHDVRPGGNQSPVCDENTKYIYEDDVQKILIKKAMPGFPQSCYIFCKNTSFLQRGHCFFDDPSEEVLRAINSMIQSNNEQFVTLLYTFCNGGNIDLNRIDESRISTLFRDISVSTPLNVEACIRKATKALKGTFLTKKDRDIYSFPHSSMNRAVALSYSEISNSTKLQVISMLSTTFIVDIVKPENERVDPRVINVPKALYSDVADELAARIREGDFCLLKCSIFNDNDFLSIFVPRYKGFSENLAPSHLRYIFRYGMLKLAKALLVSCNSTVDDLNDNNYAMVMKESSIYRHVSAVQYLIHERRDSLQKTNVVIRNLEYCIQNNEITSILVQNLPVSKLDNIQVQAVLKVLTRNESLASFQYIISTAMVENEIVGHIANLAGRRNANNCIQFLLERFSSNRNEIIIHAIEGACKGGHDKLIDWAIEHYPELLKKKAADFLPYAEFPSTLEKLHLRYESNISKLEYSEALNALCAKGKSLCVKVLLDRCDIFSEADIQNAIRAAVRKGHLKTVNVIMETFSVPHEIVSELVETVRRSDNMRPHSAYPFTPAHTPASVLSQNMFTPCSYEQTQKRHSKALCLKRCMTNRYLSAVANVYSRAYKLISIIRDKSIDQEDRLKQCSDIIESMPEKSEDLIMESAVYTLHDEELFSILLSKYPTIWKSIFSSCRNDRKQIKNLLTNMIKHHKCKQESFLHSLLDFAIQNKENISDFIHLLIETECTFSVEEFNSTLRNLIVSQTEIAKMLVQNVEDITSENSVFFPLTLCCKSNDMDVFKFIWINITDKKDVFFDLLSKDIMDLNGQALNIMLQDITSCTSMDEIILRCFQKRARKWISNLSRSHQQELLFSTELIKSELLRENNAAGLALLTQYLNIGLDESSNLLIQACGKGWRKVIQTVLKKHDKIAGEVILESINSLVKAKHYALLFCFKEPLKECNLTPSQCTGILDLLYSNCGGSEKITTLLKSVMLIPCFASQVSSSQIFSHLRRNDDTLQIVMSILRNDLYETQVKKIVFEIIREREIDISDTVHELFYDRCSMKNSFVRNTDEFIHYLMDIDYIDESQRTEGMRLCFFQEEIKNQAIAIMIMRKDRTTLSLKFGTSNIFMKICKCHDWFEEAECFLFLNRDDIDEPSLEAGIHNLLQHPKRVLCSTAIMSVIIERRIDIVCGASSVFSLICKGYGDSTSHQILLLKYIMEQHTATIKKQFIDGFNEAICNNIEAAVEICQVFQEQINLSEYILLLFLIDTFTYESAYRIDLIIKLSDILHVDKAMCMKFAHNAIPRKQRWEVLVGLFGSSVKEDMAWKLLCLCCERYPSSLREIFSNSGINLTSQQIEYLKEKYPFVHEYCLLNRLFMFSSNMN